jgi:hypothetical protein
VVGNNEDHANIWKVGRNTELFLKLSDLVKQAIESAPSLSAIPLGSSLAPCSQRETRADSEQTLRSRYLFVQQFGPALLPKAIQLLVGLSGNIFSKVLTVPDEDDAPPELSTLSPLHATFGSSQQSQPVAEQPATAIDFSEPKIFPRLPCYMLSHSDNPSFHGRSEILDELDKALLPSKKITRQGVRGFALTGLGGIGKTQIAVKYVNSRKHHFNAVFWVGADEKLKLAEEYNKIAAKLQLIKDWKDADRVVSRSVVLEWLSEPNKAPEDPSAATDTHETDQATWLLVLDNADDLELIQDYLPINGKGSVLITSRDPVARTIFRAGMELPPFNAEEAASFLEAQTYPIETPDDQRYCDELVQRLGRLPLALSQIGGIMTRKDLSFKEIYDEYEKELAMGDLHRSSLLPLTQQYDLTLATVWSLDTLEPNGRTLLEILALLDPDSLTETMLRLDDAMAISPTFPSTKDYEIARTDLIKASLISRNKRLGKLEIHRVVQDVARGKMDMARYVEQFMVAVRLLNKYWPEDPLALKFSHSITDQHLAEVVATHVTKLKNHYESRKPRLASDVLRAFAGLVARAAWSVSLIFSRYLLNLGQGIYKIETT